MNWLSTNAAWIAALCLVWGTLPASDKSLRKPGPKLVGFLKTEFFTVYHDDSDPFMAVLMARVARDTLVAISNDLGYRLEPGRRFPLYLYPTHTGFIKAGGLEASKFTVGTAASGDEAIAVDASGVFASVEEVLAHEITHAVVFRLLGPNAAALPLWVNEGLAQYESAGFAEHDDQVVADAAAEGTLVPLEQLASEFPKDRTDLAYAESFSAVRYLVRKHGGSAPRILLAEMARGRSFDQAMVEAAGQTGEQFAREWYSHTTRRYWALRVTRIGTGVVSALMAILAVAAFVVRRKQKIEAARRWEQEEFEEALRRQLGNDWHR